QTDFDGKYSLEAKEGDIIVFSYLGFKTQEKKVKKGTVLNVVLKADNVSLNEVVMVRQMEVSSQAMMMMAAPPPASESYKAINEKIFRSADTSPPSTFSIDVDRAAYSKIGRMINTGQEIPTDAVKIEEMINYIN